MTFRIEGGRIISSTISNVDLKKNSQLEFKKVLEESLRPKKDVKISGHAQKRMVERGIRLQENDLTRISQGMDKLEEKGGKESLMLYKDMAFIASIQNRTIITAMGNDELDIVTNIDSAIIIK